MPRRTRLYIILIIIFCIVAFFVAAILQKTTSTSSYKQTITIDKTTGEELVSTEGKDPESVGRNPNTPLLLGFSSLISYGVSTDDHSKIKQAITKYILETNTVSHSVKVSFDKTSLKQVINTDSSIDYYFTIVLDDKETRSVQLHTDGITISSIIISDKDGNVVYKLN